MPQARPLSSWIEEPGELQCIHSQLCTALQPAASQCSKVTTTEANAEHYLDGLHRGAAIQAIAVTASTQQSKDKVLHELNSWQHLHAAGRTARSCIPEDVIVSIVTHWAGQHGGCRALDGSRFAAPVSLEAMISHLSVELEKLGRTGPWQGAIRTAICADCPCTHSAAHKISMLKGAVLCRQSSGQHSDSYVSKRL